jgi:hypothetical protein
VSPTDLWPPLELVEAALDGHHALAQAASVVPPESINEGFVQAPLKVDKDVQAAYLLLPLTELADRRAAVLAKNFSADWAPGRLVQMTVNDSVVGILLDRLVQGTQWTGWFAACESNWASEFDVLLEPMDEPFEPMFGVIQAWNTVTVDCTENNQALVVGEISATRLAAIRAVALECASGLMLATPAEPGRIGLRTAGGTFSVLTGTPLGPHDIRYNYQNAYRTATARLIAQQLTQRLSYVKKKAPLPVDLWSRAKEWFAADWMIRPAFAVVAVFFIAQNTGLLGRFTDDAVRFRSSPTASAAGAAAAAGDLRVQWKPDVKMDEVQKLLRSTAIEVVDGPDAEGFYGIKSNDTLAARASLSQSALVAQVIAP